MLFQVSAVALFAGLAAAVHAPVGDPSGNNITRPLNEVVNACSQFTITWLPSTPNTVSLLLLKGPSSNVVPIATIKEGLSNSGSFAWNVPSGLQASTGNTGYGIQLIDDVTGQYQYSTQFGISNQLCGAVSSGYPVYSASASASSVRASSSASAPSSVSASSISRSSAAPASSVAVSSAVKASSKVAASSYAVAPTGAPVSSSLVILPSASMTIPSTLPVRPSATTSGPVQVTGTGAASHLNAGLGFAGAVAGFVFFL